VNREARLIGMPAVFARWKGQLQVLDAFEQVQGDLPDVHLVLVGGSIYDTMAEREYGEQLGREIARRTSRAGGRVHLLPFQREVEHVYPEFDVVVHYSLRPEAFGRVVVEAMACGTPVIAAGEGGPVEILGASGDARQAGGWLVEPRSPEKLGMALHRALTLGGDALREIGDAGRRRAEDLFSARRFAREVAEVLRGRVQGEGVDREKSAGGRGKGLGETVKRET
jgi:glycosyltransferase involved in cell wall biosynthesis